MKARGYREPAYHSQPLTTYLDGATRLRIVCESAKSGGCRHNVEMTLEELMARAPRAITFKDFSERLRCSKCQSRGWIRIEPIKD